MIDDRQSVLVSCLAGATLTAAAAEGHVVQRRAQKRRQGGHALRLPDSTNRLAE